MSLSRLVVVELGGVLRLSYVVVAELLPRLRGLIGLKSRSLHADQHAIDFYMKCRDENFVSGILIYLIYIYNSRYDVFFLIFVMPRCQDLVDTIRNEK